MEEIRNENNDINTDAREDTEACGQADAEPAAAEPAEASEQTEQAVQAEAAAEQEEQPEPEDKLAQLERELAAARADFYNYRQRVLKERNEIRRRALEDTVQEFLPVMDNLDRALTVPEDGSAKDVLVGVEMVRRQFIMKLDEMGISVIPAKGVKFDPSLHEALASLPVESADQDGMVIEEQMRGYRTKDRVLRAAQVVVGRAN